MLGKCDCALSSLREEPPLGPIYVRVSSSAGFESLDCYQAILMVLRVFGWHVRKERVLQCALGTYPPSWIIRQHAKYHVNKVFIVSSIFRIWFSANHSVQRCDWICARDYFR